MGVGRRDALHGVGVETADSNYSGKASQPSLGSATTDSSTAQRYVTPQWCPPLAATSATDRAP